MDSDMDRLDQLASTMTRHAPKTGMFATDLPCLTLFRADQPTMRIPSVYNASLCLIAQGAKQVSVGDLTLDYDAARYLVVSVDMPMTGHIVRASPDRPYLCAKIDLDLQALADLVLAEGGAKTSSAPPILGVYPSDPDLVDAVCRLVRLIDEPRAMATLAPLIEREILYRLLGGPHGPTMRHLAAADSHLAQVSRAISEIRERYREPLRISEIAAAARMSDSSLHGHFKAVTRMTPIEFQKQLRLQEARRLMLAEGLNAGSAAFAVGYDSPSQFSREYRRLFGAPPRQDVLQLQAGRDYWRAAA